MTDTPPCLRLRGAVAGGGTRRSLAVVSVALVALACGREAVVLEPSQLLEPVEVQASVDRAVATTGDLITYRLVIDAQPDYQLEIPEAGAEIAGFRIVDVGRSEPQDRDGRIVHERWYELRADLVGSYVLPPVEVAYRPMPADGEEPAPWQTRSTSEIFVEVESVLPGDGEAVDIRGLKPLREVRPGVDWLLILVVAIAGAMVAGLVFWYLRYRAGRRHEPPPVPAHEVAFAALDRLRRTEFRDQTAVRRFYFQISEVVRTYVEGRFRLNATDLTTEEILAGLAALEDLASEQNQVLERFLVDTDQVKFAHREPSPADIETTYEQALGFVEATRPRPEPEAQAA